MNLSEFTMTAKTWITPPFPGRGKHPLLGFDESPAARRRVTSAEVLAEESEPLLERHDLRVLRPERHP